MKKEKAGFWCPEDVDEGIKSLIERGLYQDRSKAIVALLRTSLQVDKQLPGDLQKRVETLASYLQRDTDIIVRQCVEGILEMIDASEPIVPLIVEEVRLRQEHGQKPGKR